MCAIHYGNMTGDDHKPCAPAGHDPGPSTSAPASKSAPKPSLPPYVTVPKPKPSLPPYLAVPGPRPSVVTGPPGGHDPAGPVPVLPGPKEAYLPTGDTILSGIDDENILWNIWANYVVNTTAPLDPVMRYQDSIACIGQDSCKYALAHLQAAMDSGHVTRSDIARAKLIAQTYSLVRGDFAGGGTFSSSDVMATHDFVMAALIQLATPPGAVQAITTAPRGSGGLTVISEDVVSASERRMAQILAEEGNAVVVRSPGQLGGTSDLVVNGMQWDVYTPTTGSVDNIVSLVASKGRQVNGGGVIIDVSQSPLTADEVANAMWRVQSVTSRVSQVRVVG